MIERPSKDITAQILSLRRPYLRTMMALLIGHCALRKHMNRMGIFTGNHKCRLCGLAEETAWRVIRECEPLRLRRYQLVLLNWDRKFHKKDVSRLLRPVKDSGLFS